jgi:1,4-alpha-glucan branching enzyme
MRWINDEIDGRQPWKLSIAEDMQDNEWGTRRTGAGGAGFDTQWDAGFLHPVRHALTRTWDQDRDLYAVAEAIGRRYNGDALQRVVYTESHDEVATSNGKRRLPEDIDPGHAGSWYARKRSTLGAVLVFTVPGIPMIFQGQELLEDGSWHDDDPVDWSRRASNAGIVRLYHDLIALRRNRDDTTGGLRGQHVHVHHVTDADKVLAFHASPAEGHATASSWSSTWPTEAMPATPSACPERAAGGSASTATALATTRGSATRTASTPLPAPAARTPCPTPPTSAWARTAP